MDVMVLQYANANYSINEHDDDSYIISSHYYMHWVHRRRGLQLANDKCWFVCCLCICVCLCVGHIHELCKNSWTTSELVWNRLRWA